MKKKIVLLAKFRVQMIKLMWFAALIPVLSPVLANADFREEGLWIPATVIETVGDQQKQSTPIETKDQNGAIQTCHSGLEGKFPNYQKECVSALGLIVS